MRITFVASVPTNTSQAFRFFLSRDFINNTICLFMCIAPQNVPSFGGACLVKMAHAFFGKTCTHVLVFYFCVCVCAYFIVELSAKLCIFWSCVFTEVDPCVGWNE